MNNYAFDLHIYCDAKIYLFIPEQDFISARVKTGQVST